MGSFALDDDERGSNASSDNDQDELMEDAEDIDMDVEDPDLDPDADGDADGDDDGEDDGEDDADDADDDENSVSNRRPSPPTASTSYDGTRGSVQINGSGPTSHPQPTVTRTSASPRQGSAPLSSTRIRLEVRPEASNASTFDIVPTIAAPQSTSINAIAATPDMRYWFTGGSDCYVRKYDGVASVNGKTLLTVAQRHPFVDSVVKAGILMSYWDNEEPISKGPTEENALSPVYSLAVQSQALWMLSGLESGCINLYSVRHDEGKRITFLQKHKSAVSALTLAQDEKSVLSGSWDKQVFDWDLNTGQVKRSFEVSGGQISAIEVRPASSLPVPEESGEIVQTNGTFSSNNAEKPLLNGNTGLFSNGTGDRGKTTLEGLEDAPGSPADSLFGGGSDANSLFGETAGGPSGGTFGDDYDEFSRAIEMGLETQTQLDVEHHDGDNSDVPMFIDNETTEDMTMALAPVKVEEAGNKVQSPSVPLTNGVTHTEGIIEAAETKVVNETQDAVATSDSTFLAASIDGTLRIWDRRQPNPVARIPTRTGVPPWCMAACWSPDGNYIYAGRRNGTVEEFSLHKGLKAAERTFKFPQGSGAVSAVRTMPNGRHLICASHDILRLYDLKEPQSIKHSTVPFLIVPGPPRAGVISALHIDPTCKYMLSAAGNRGWEGSTTEVLIGYEIGIPA